MMRVRRHTIEDTKTLVITHLYVSEGISYFVLLPLLHFALFCFNLFDTVQYCSSRMTATETSSIIRLVCFILQCRRYESNPTIWCGVLEEAKLCRWMSSNQYYDARLCFQGFVSFWMHIRNLRTVLQSGNILTRPIQYSIMENTLPKYESSYC